MQLFENLCVSLVQVVFILLVSHFHFWVEVNFIYVLCGIDPIDQMGVQSMILSTIESMTWFMDNLCVRIAT